MCLKLKFLCFCFISTSLCSAPFITYGQREKILNKDTSFIDYRGRKIKLNILGLNSVSVKSSFYSYFYNRRSYDTDYSGSFITAPNYCERGGIPPNPTIKRTPYPDFDFQDNYQTLNVRIQDYINYIYNINFRNGLNPINIFNDYSTHAFKLKFTDVTDQITKGIPADSSCEVIVSNRAWKRLRDRKFFEVTVEDTLKRIALVDTFENIRTYIEKNFSNVDIRNTPWIRSQISQTKVLITADNRLHDLDITAGNALFDQTTCPAYMHEICFSNGGPISRDWAILLKAKLFYTNYKEIDISTLKFFKMDDSAFYFVGADKLIKVYYQKNRNISFITDVEIVKK